MAIQVWSGKAEPLKTRQSTQHLRGDILKEVSQREQAEQTVGCQPDVVAFDCCLGLFRVASLQRAAPTRGTCARSQVSECLRVGLTQVYKICVAVRGVAVAVAFHYTSTESHWGPHNYCKDFAV